MPVLCFTILLLYIFYLEMISGELHEEMECTGFMCPADLKPLL